MEANIGYALARVRKATPLLCLAIAACGGGGIDEHTGTIQSDARTVELEEREVSLAASDYNNRPKILQGKPSQELLNGSFETDGFTGWHVDIPLAPTYGGRPPIPAGTVGVVSSWPSVSHSATDGNFFVYVASLVMEQYYQPSGSYDIFVGQKVLMQSGDALQGDSFYYNGDHASQEKVWVKIYDAAGKLISTPWQEVSGAMQDGASVPYHHYSEWKTWSWVANKPGVYTLKLGVSTRGDNMLATYGFHDNIRLIQQQKQTN